MVASCFDASVVFAVLMSDEACVVCVSGELDACAFDASYPRQYVGYKLEPGQSIVVDGRIDDAAWREVGFTEEFVDIMGSPPMPVPRFNTQAKIRWDDEWLYFAGFVSEPQIWANNTVHDCVIYSDNDFEIFVNADGMCDARAWLNNCPQQPLITTMCNELAQQEPRTITRSLR